MQRSGAALVQSRRGAEIMSLQSSELKNSLEGFLAVEIHCDPVKGGNRRRRRRGPLVCQYSPTTMTTSRRRRW